ncbi:DUF1460 domain-containing protein [Sodalis sp. dw_96]|uniref:DUF1460 domain-containing protein n=1 Tax=Sodalis sp. dw_96 TaxID=2719794 RepID=UPI001BD482D4|nr:DUF1460 domain-containing protein [Sodalis sp. dw_96]
MGKKIFLSLAVALTLTGCAGHQQDAGDNAVNTDSATRHRIERLMAGQGVKAAAAHEGEAIAAISADFLGTPYVADTLIGSDTQTEQLVINFHGVDCFTYLDYVYALSKSADAAQFSEHLRQTRYVNGDVSYRHRKQFFTDWSHLPPLNATDVTRAVSPNAVTVTKNLNQTADGGKYFPSLDVTTREITYIPAKAVNSAVIHRLKDGDFIGIYTPKAGMDVTHTGIFVMTEGGPMLRNASSRAANRKVVDSPFLAYVRRTPGIVVLRGI